MISPSFRSRHRCRLVRLLDRRRTLRVEPLEPRLVLQGLGFGGPPSETPPFEVPPNPGPPEGVPHVDAPPPTAGAPPSHAEGANWIDFSFRKHKKHVDHVTWDPDPADDALVTVKVLIHNHSGNLDGEKLARMYDAVAEVNTAFVGIDDVLLKLVAVTSGEDIHLHEDSNSGCGSNALGCAEFSIFIANTGEYADGHENHLYAGENDGGTAEATLLSNPLWDWYTGGDANGIANTGQYDYQTVATQELLHLVGLGHDSTVYANDTEVDNNTDEQSVMHGSLAPNTVRRFMSTHDQEVLGHLYGPGQTAAPTNDGDDGDSGNGGGPGGNGPPGRNNQRASGLYAEVTNTTDFGALPAASERSSDVDLTTIPLSSERSQPMLRAARFEDRSLTVEANDLYRARHARREAADRRLEAIESVFELWSGGLSQILN